jgi:hypothetical protein
MPRRALSTIGRPASAVSATPGWLSRTLEFMALNNPHANKPTVHTLAAVGAKRSQSVPGGPSGRQDALLRIKSLVRSNSLPKNLRTMGGLYGVGVFARGPVMDTRRSYYLASRQDDFDVPASGWVDSADISYVTPANDNLRAKDSLSARCGSLPRRLIALHSLRWLDYNYEQRRSICLPTSVPRTDREAR